MSRSNKGLKCQHNSACTQMGREAQPLHTKGPNPSLSHKRRSINSGSYSSSTVQQKNTACFDICRKPSVLNTRPFTASGCVAMQVEGKKNSNTLTSMVDQSNKT